MFAAPSRKKDEQNRKLALQKREKKVELGNPNSKMKKINKIASIRTLPPFAYFNSDSGNNSQNKSVQCSETHSQIWKQDCELFESAQKDTINTLDKQLQDVLETIIKERNLIDLKIWKLKSRFQSNQEKPRGKQKGEFPLKIDVATSPLDEAYSSVGLIQSQKSEQGVQFPQSHHLSSHFQELANRLGLKCCNEGQIGEKPQKIDEDVKIKQNKIVLGMLFDKISQPDLFI